VVLWRVVVVVVHHHGSVVLGTSVNHDKVKLNDKILTGLDKLYLWSAKWQLNIAAHKCCVLHIGYNIKN